MFETTQSKIRGAFTALVVAGIASQVPGWLAERAKKDALNNLIIKSQMPDTRLHGCSSDYIPRSFGFDGCSYYLTNTFKYEVQPSKSDPRLSSWGLSREGSRRGGFKELGSGYSLRGNVISWSNNKRGDSEQMRVLGLVVSGRLDVKAVPKGMELQIDLDSGKVTRTEQVFSLVEKEGLSGVAQKDVVEEIDLGGPVLFSKYGQYPEFVQQALKHILEKMRDDLEFYAQKRKKFVKYFSRDYAYKEGIEKCKPISDEGYANAVQGKIAALTAYSIPAFLDDLWITDFLRIAERLKKDWDENSHFLNTPHEIVQRVIAARDLALATADLNKFDPDFGFQDNQAIDAYREAHCPAASSPQQN